MDYKHIKGFNYQPSYGSNTMDIWEKFDPEVIKRELGWGKKYFPEINTVRIWLSWNQYSVDPANFVAKVHKVFEIAASYGLKIIPVLFNRWHCWWQDYGGIYIDHMLSKGWCHNAGSFHDYTKTIVTQFADYDSILAWDICNEPFTYNEIERGIYGELYRLEFEWLKEIYDLCKENDKHHPVSVGAHAARGIRDFDILDQISDVYMIHPYFVASLDDLDARREYEELLDDYVAIARKAGKGLLSTETCWGHVDDLKHAKVVEYTLSEHKKRGIGWVVYSLMESFVADLHNADKGPVWDPGDLSFIRMDGSLRSGHEVFNNF